MFSRGKMVCPNCGFVSIIKVKDIDKREFLKCTVCKIQIPKDMWEEK